MKILIGVFIVSFLTISPTQLKAQFLREDTIINNRIYRSYSNYLLLSVGKSYNFKNTEIETSGEVGYVFRIVNQFFQVGYHLSSDQFFLNRSYQKLNNIFLMYGLRKEKINKNTDIFFGLSYAYGSTYWGVDSKGDILYKGFSVPGFRISLDYEWKIFYDIGIGLNGYAEWNQYYPLIGIKLNIYFSGAFRGELN
ncbi:MAG TPA: hypothetical protein EYP69_00970 [Bacteroidales bacterium]|nr:hypothetical protein [Bacteroidales bacterium]